MLPKSVYPYIKLNDDPSDYRTPENKIIGIPFLLLSLTSGNISAIDVCMPNVVRKQIVNKNSCT